MTSTTPVCRVLRERDEPFTIQLPRNPAPLINNAREAASSVRDVTREDPPASDNNSSARRVKAAFVKIYR